jgi:hypothetical protein
MNEKKIRVTIDPIGNSKVEAIGYNGAGCAEATKSIEEALAGGRGGMERVMKPEWNNPSSEEEGVQQGVRW